VEEINILEENLREEYVEDANSNLMGKNGRN
jgi:hypothetical protein